MQGLDIIIFAGIAVFFILKLLGVIGQRSEEEEANHDKPKNNLIDIHQRYQEAKKFARNQKNVLNDRPDEDDSGVVIDISSKGATISESFHHKLAELDIKPTSKIGKGLKKINSQREDFDPVEFLNGAEAAFEMILNAYAKGEVPLLKNLLTKNLYKVFEQAISQRKKSGERMELVILAVDNIEIVDAAIESGDIAISIKFTSEQNSVTYDKNDVVISGDPKDKEIIADIWTFTKPLNSNNPNWYLAATGSAEN